MAMKDDFCRDRPGDTSSRGGPPPKPDHQNSDENLNVVLRIATIHNVSTSLLIERRGQFEVLRSHMRPCIALMQGEKATALIGAMIMTDVGMGRDDVNLLLVTFLEDLATEFTRNASVLRARSSGLLGRTSASRLA